MILFNGHFESMDYDQVNIKADIGGMFGAATILTEWR